MPPKKRGKAATSKSRAKAISTRQSTRQNARDADVPDVYEEMLADLPDEEIGRPAKRRKFTPDHTTYAKQLPELTDSPTRQSEELCEDAESLAATEIAVGDLPPEKMKLTTPSKETPHQQQIAYDDTATDSDGSIEFEDVDIEGTTAEPSIPPSTTRATEPVTISLATPRKPVSRRKQITKADRLHRLAVHKWHYLCLLLHMATLNQWCNNPDVQSSLKKLISRKLISRLHREGTQAERKFAFDSAMHDVNDVWKNSFTKNGPGMKRATWRDLTILDLAEEMENAPEPVDLHDFKDAAKAKKRRGSPDLGAQLFCALCRALAVEARLVCSLQVLPFTMATGKSGRNTDDYIQAGDQDFGTSTSTNGRDQPTFSNYPIWWVEVLNPAIDQWIAVDPDSSHQSYNQPRTHYEPPASDNLNSMSYVIAFDENGAARDITRRYASAFNAKTRKARVESTKDGERWLKNVMSFFAKGTPEPRDQIEDAELNRRVALEGMPKNVQDFKDHPVYVLERHLRSNEVIEPKKQCGRLKVGKDKLETVYRREHVHACRTADGWYRKGRNVIAGMQPLRHVPKRRGPNEEEEEPFAALYAEYQTEVYVPPEVRDGRVPRNAFGNLDIYVPTMIPGGSAHVRHPFAIKAAKVLGIDYAEAVIGFKFKGRQGTAITDGVVIAAEHLSAVKEVTIGIEEETIEETNDQRDAILERVWSAMMRVLRVQQMVEQKYGVAPTRKVPIYDRDEEDEQSGLEDEADDEDDLTYGDEEEAGGFTVEATEANADTRAEEAALLSTLKDNRPISLPPPVLRQKIIVSLSPYRPSLRPPLAKDESYNDLFDDDPVGTAHGCITSVQPARDENADGGSFIAEAVEGGGFIAEEVQGGGFVDDEMAGGGFINEEGESGGFVAGPIDNSHSNKSSLTSNVISGSYQDHDMGVSDLTSRDCLSKCLSSSGEDPISTPDYPEVATHTRNGSASADEQAQKDTARQLSSLSGAPPDVHDKADMMKPGAGEAKGKTTAHGDEADETSSLPSHDPEEDDMEPDWVAQVFSPES